MRLLLAAALGLAAVPAAARGGIEIVVTGELRVEALDAAPAAPRPRTRGLLDTGQAVVGVLSAPLARASQAAKLKAWGFRQVVAPPGANIDELAATARLLEKEGVELLMDDEHAYVARYRGRKVGFLVFEPAGGASRVAAAVAAARKDNDHVVAFVRGGAREASRAAAGAGADAVVGVSAPVGAARLERNTAVVDGLGSFLGRGDGAVLRLLLGEPETAAELSTLEAEGKAAARVRSALALPPGGRIRLRE